jgi:hypothetical protein
LLLQFSNIKRERKPRSRRLSPKSNSLFPQPVNCVADSVKRCLKTLAEALL